MNNRSIGDQNMADDIVITIADNGFIVSLGNGELLVAKNQAEMIKIIDTYTTDSSD